jgi:hypothetical protein
MNKPTLVLFGSFKFTDNTVTLTNIESAELFIDDLEDIYLHADRKCERTGMDYLIPECYDGIIIWREQPVEVDRAYAAIDKAWAMTQENNEWLNSKQKTVV